MTVRGTFVYRDGELVPKHLAAPLVSRGAASSLPAPMVISDATDAFKSMADGRFYESKSSYRTELRRRGLREIGNDIEGHLQDVEASNPQKPKAKADVIKAYQKVKQGYKPPPAPPLDPDLE